VNDNLLTGAVPDDYVFLNQLSKFVQNELVYAVNSSRVLTFLLLPCVNSGLVRIDRNSLTGEIPSTFCTAIDTAGAALFADCLEVNCPCCLYCCFDTLPDCRCTLAAVAPDQCELEIGF
jgi:hypothetical protein